ncbi:MAG: hypothetical protein KAX19_05910 [Candidatus Brocadiae bacterium]|nr:hypothetical protein [Candidatus Brocadiia bacterium]
MKGDLLWVTIVIPAVLAVLMGAIFSLLKRRSRAIAQRREQMHALAESLGLRYYGRAGADALSFLPRFSLLERGYEKTLSSLMAEDRQPPRLLLFDYEFLHSARLSGGRHSDLDFPVLYLVAMAALPDTAQVTAARIYREDWFGGPVGVAGTYRLDAGGPSRFSRDCLVAGEPREAVRRMLTEPVQEAIVNWSPRGPRPVVEIAPGWVVAHVESDPGDREVARRASGLLKYASAIAGRLAEGTA